MTRQFPHPHATLPGHDPSKVRDCTAPDCITASKCEALDVRVLKVAEHLQGMVDPLYSRGFGTAGIALARDAETLRTIAAEIRDGACQPLSPRTAATLRHGIANARTEAELASAWRDVNPTVMTMTMLERLDLMQAFITRMCVVTQDDGR